MEAHQRLAYLFRRYYEKTCTLQEKDELFDLLLLSEYDELLRALIDESWRKNFPLYPQDNRSADDILRQILSQQEFVPSDSPALSAGTISRSGPRFLQLARWAALFIGAALISFFVFRFRPHYPALSLQTTLPAPVSTPADQCLTLSDGSKVLLHNNARIDYRPGFSDTTREVVLHGEAYFDIRRDTRPFIVHTGTLRTTVLGTAFNINAHDERDIVITVTKGKVKVENGKGEYRILRRNEQLAVDSLHTHLKKTLVDAGETLAWKKPYLLFNDVTMKEAMGELAQRYHADITFSNPAAENCPVTASFTSNESLEQVIKVLSKINNMEYTVDHGHILISGEGCK
jgi:ferric-dicitrate binding protein FerR (iron transport regulator)